ncbi:MAG: hypothetical protein IJF61_02320 [Clostridia bacterium]|nr:hypothetical protein [Clostridia bacterium]
MKKIIALSLAIVLLLSLAACNKAADTGVSESGGTETGQKQEETVTVGEADGESAGEAEKNDETAEDKKPEQKPSATPEAKPEQTPAPTPTPAPVASTLGKTLLADFKTKASMDTLSLANALLENPAIQFMGGAMEVEEGLLSGFDNAEIRGFKSGAVFMPMIGSIAFIGYVFELDNAADVPAFIATLEKNANRRWNVCVEAEEMVTGSVGNKVFFVMCPTSLEG